MSTRADSNRESPRAAVPPDEMQQCRRYLWAICYRMTGSSADADDLVQETFAKALSSSSRGGAPMKPWLTAITVNLSRDWLRSRRRAPYIGTWLPSPIETDEDLPSAVEARLADGSSTEGRYSLLESVTLAFLVALEALRPQQRAVLLLRDVFDYSVRETAECLGISEDNVKTSHLRARRTMRDYDRDRCIPDSATQKRTRETLEQLMGFLLAADVAGIEALLSRSVRSLADGGGEFLAAQVPVVGVERVAKFFVRLLELRGAPTIADIRTINGLPALVAAYDHGGPKDARRFVNAFRLDGEGRVLEGYSVSATAKLTHIRFNA